MADVHLLSIRVVDDVGVPGHVNVFLPNALTIAEVQTFLDSFAVYLDNIIGATLDKATVALALTLPGTVKSNALANMPIQLGANFAFDVENTPYRWTLHVPSIRTAMLVGENVDLTDTDIITFHQSMTSGIATFEPTSREGGDLLSLLAAVRSFRKA